MTMKVMNGHAHEATMQARLHAAQETVSGYAHHLGRGASEMGRTAYGQVHEAARRAGEALSASAGAMLGMGMLSGLFSRSGRHPAPPRADAAFVDAVAARIERRLTHSGRFRRAVARELSEEMRPKTRPRRRRMGLLRLGVWAVAAYGLNYAVRQATGRSLVDRMSSRQQPGS